MASTIEIANRALSQIGEDPILNLEENTRRARAVRKHFDGVRDDTLRKGLWNFATSRITLAADATPPDWGFSNRFKLPADFIRVAPDIDDSLSGLDTRYKIEGQYLLYDDQTVQLKYIRRVEETGLWDPMFVSAFVFHLAAYIEPEITGNNENWTTLIANYRSIVLEAMGVGSQEGTADPFQVDDWLTARF